MKKIRLTLLCAMGFFGSLSADAYEDQKAEQQRLENQRLEQKRVDDAAYQRKLDDAAYQRKLDDQRWNEQHGH